MLPRCRRGAQDPAALAAFLTCVDAVLLDEVAAHHPFIAAHARALDLTLATNDTAEFAPVRALTIESWTVSPAAPLE